MNNTTPLAEKMRPEDLDGFFGQEELVGKGSFLRNAIKEDNVPSMVLWGPPGSGKTTLAHIIAKQTKAEFRKLSATGSGVKELREIIKLAEQAKRLGNKTILFIDEIHRWNKKQQDALLPHVEKGIVTLIGATTENPSFEVNSALISRSRVMVLKKLEVKDIIKILNKAIKKISPSPKFGEGAGGRGVIFFIAQMANGDARMALNTLEACVGTEYNSVHKKIDIKLVKQILQKSHLLYDKNGEEHYNIISALHKSMRAGKADAAIYWLARMLEGGEDPLYVARRLVRFASEDIGLANNTALLLANAVFDACHKLGMPECSVHLAQCVIYLSNSKKDTTAYKAYSKAKEDVEKEGNLPVPMRIRNAPTKLMKDLGYGQGEEEFLPAELNNKKYL